MEMRPRVNANELPESVQCGDVLVASCHKGDYRRQWLHTQRSVERMTNELKTEALADASINEGLVRWFPNSATLCITPMEVMQA